VASTIASVAAGLGVPPALALAIANQESGFRPKLHYADASGRGTDTGLYALNDQGEGKGYNWKDLLAPALNSKIALSEVAHVLGEYKKNPNNVLNQFSRLVRADYPDITHAQIMDLAGTMGEIAVVAQRPGGIHHGAYDYAKSINASIIGQAKKMAKSPRSQRLPKKQAFHVYNSTSSRVAISANAAAIG
jgi:hypothetical protein